jgi:hypothetical protein
VLKAIRQQRSAALVTVMVALVAWLFVSNRCGLALMLSHGSAAEAHRCCQPEPPAHQAPADHSPLCCKSLSVTLAENAPLAAFQAPAVAVIFCAWMDLAPMVMAPIQPGWSTGPPDAPPLLSCILVSSRQAHGPPALA